MTTTIEREPITLQLWPSGDGITYAGDINGPELEIQDDDTWRPTTKQERRDIQREEYARQYQSTEVLCCDSSLVDALIERSGGSTGDLAEEFGVDNIRGLYPDPEDWDVSECREWLDDFGHAWPITPEELGDVAREVRDEQDSQLSDDVLSDMGHFKYVIANSEESLDIDDWREAIRDNAEAAEVLEWWRVTEWLADKLDAIGVPTINNAYGAWWGRTCSGQGFLMDGTLQKVAEEFID